MRAIATPRVPTATPKGPAFLDWTKHQVGPLMPCRICRRKALLRDEHGRPCHKTCAEAELSKTFTEGNPTMSEGTS